jgi:uncharacterized protein YqeY
MSTIKSRINEDMKTAMRAQDKERLGTIRLIMAAMKQKEVDERIELTDEHVLAILNKMVKQRREAITQYEAGNRPDLVKKESNEILVIQAYLPSQMSEAEVEKAIADAMQESGATSAKDMGKIMAILKAKLQGKADMTVVSAKVKEKLS